jgi:hypothetical protein
MMFGQLRCQTSRATGGIDFFVACFCLRLRLEATVEIKSALL